ncbi:MAG: WD40 repeat domain-containing protein, partial [Deltaproteobacteria bacterium]|nr:WD40 repeat domain-containing protein [Deltaproteobacteria bacterium]
MFHLFRKSTGVLLALQSIRLESNASAYRSLLLSMSALNDLEVYLWAPDQKLNSVTFSPEGNSISALSQDDTVLTWDLEKPLRNQIPNDKGFHKVNELSISDSGSEVLVAFEGGDIVID